MKNININKENILFYSLKKVVFWLILLCILIFFMFPIVWLLSTSFKNFVDAFAIPPKIIFQPTLDNYRSVFNNGDFLKYLINSIVISFGSTFICMLLGVPAAYAIAAFEFKKKHDLTLFILTTRIAPPIMSLLPLFIIFNRLDLVGSRIPLIIMYVLMNLPLVIWILPVYFREIPNELRESSIIDGCTEWEVFYRIMLPLTKAGISATSILCIIQAWNEFLFALVLSGKDSQTLPVAITSFMTFQGTQWGPLSAAGTIIMVPMIVFAFIIQRNFVKGMTLGAVKG